jgi:hypothetical protein
VLIHQSELLPNNAVVVQGRAGVLLIDPAIQGDEMAALANDLREFGQAVVAGFSTHPDWDHLLWHVELGDAARHGTARCAADIRELLSEAGWEARVAEVLPPDIGEEIPLDLFGLITGLPAATAQIPWDGPRVRIIEHQPHAPGHAAVCGTTSRPQHLVVAAAWTAASCGSHRIARRRAKYAVPLTHLPTAALRWFRGPAPTPVNRPDSSSFGPAGASCVRPGWALLDLRLHESAHVAGGPLDQRPEVVDLGRIEVREVGLDR